MFSANPAAFKNLTEENQHLGENVAASVTEIQTQIQNLTHMLHNMTAATTRQNPPTFTTPPPNYQQQPLATMYGQPEQYNTPSPPPQQYDGFHS